MGTAFLKKNRIQVTKNRSFFLLVRLSSLFAFRYKMENLFRPAGSVAVPENRLFSISALKRFRMPGSVDSSRPEDCYPKTNGLCFLYLLSDPKQSRLGIFFVLCIENLRAGFSKAASPYSLLRIVPESPTRQQREAVFPIACRSIVPAPPGKLFRHHSPGSGERRFLCRLTMDIRKPGNINMPQ